MQFDSHDNIFNKHSSSGGFGASQPEHGFGPEPQKGGPIHVNVDEHGSYRAAWSGNWLGRSLGTNVRYRRASNLAGRNASEARAGLESEVVDADPPVNRGRQHGQGRNRQVHLSISYLWVVDTLWFLIELECSSQLHFRLHSSFSASITTESEYFVWIGGPPHARKPRTCEL